MSKRNQYSFSKRQREIKKKKKAEEKRAKKVAKSDVPGEGEDGFLDEEGEEFESMEDESELD